jgi:hypothetical protein
MNPAQVLLVLTAISACTPKAQSDTADTGETAEPVDTGDTDDTGTPIDNTLTEGLTLFGGCSDIFMYAKNAEDTLGLFVSANGLVATAFASDAGDSAFNLAVASAESGLKITVQSGKNITQEACNDALDPELAPVVHSELLAVSGNARFTIMPTGEATAWGEMPANATLLLENLVLQNESDTNSVEINDWGFDAAVGWLPG